MPRLTTVSADLDLLNTTIAREGNTANLYGFPTWTWSDG